MRDGREGRLLGTRSGKLVQWNKQKMSSIGSRGVWRSDTLGPGARGLPAPVEQKGGRAQPGDRVCLTALQQGHSSGSTGTSVEQGGHWEALTAEARGGQGAQRSPG